jgi:uncharacterized membrane protein HdeD (DUF308 family)
MNTTVSLASEPAVQRRGWTRFGHAALLLLSVLLLAVAAVRFHSSIHFLLGGVFMLVSGAALTVSAFDSISGSKTYETRLVITAVILSLTVGFLLIGLH